MQNPRVGVDGAVGMNPCVIIALQGVLAVVGYKMSKVEVSNKQ